MRQTRLSRWIAGSIALVALSACGLLSTSYRTYRYRMTVEVDTPSGLRTGSSVYEVRTSKTGSNFPASPNQVSYEVRGKSVAVDLPGGTLFTIIEPDWIGSALIIVHNLERAKRGEREEPTNSATIRGIIRDGRLFVLPRYFFPIQIRIGQVIRRWCGSATPRIPRASNGSIPITWQTRSAAVSGYAV